METNKILQANILDLVFDGRNKAYGAYELRKNYNKRVITSLAIVLGGIICFIVINIAHEKNHKTTVQSVAEPFHLVTVKTKPIDIKKDKAKEKPHQKTAFKKVSKNPLKMEIKRNVTPKIT